MKPATKPTDVNPCPNCGVDVTVPKSTRSFICKSCEAIIKVVHTESGFDLKVVGKSVEENEAYRYLEAQIAEVKAELAEMHQRYQLEMARPAETGAFRLGLLGVAGILAGLVVTIWSLRLGAALLLAGLAAAIAGFGSNSSTKRARLGVAKEMTDTIARIGAQRDFLQRKAARIKTQV